MRRGASRVLRPQRVRATATIGRVTDGAEKARGGGSDPVTTPLTPENIIVAVIAAAVLLALLVAMWR